MIKANQIVLGIDESGRGSVVGPMVIVGVVVRSEHLDYLKNCGVRDSKAFTDKSSARTEREHLSNIICSTCQYVIQKASPTLIDKYVNSPPPLNLNQLERDMVESIITHVSRTGLIPDVVVMDGASIFSPLLDQIQKCFPNANIIAQDKADTIYPAVQAASIVAKSTRDKITRDIMNEEYFSKGAGYPNEHTLRWVRSWFKTRSYYEHIYNIRRSWKWWDKAIEKLREE